MSIIYQYDVPDVVCGRCAGTIDNALRQSAFFKGQSLGVDSLEKKLTISFEDDYLSYFEVRDLLNEVLEPVGFSCTEVSETKRIQENKAKFSHRALGVTGIGVGTLLLLLSLVMGALPLWLMVITTSISTLLTVFLGAESYQKAWKKLKVRTLTMDTLFSLSTISIVIVSIASLFFTSLPMMCEASLLIFGFRHVGLAIEEAFKKSSSMSQRFQDDAPKHLTMFSQGKKVMVQLASIQKNDRLILEEGSIIPVDGIFEESDGLILDRIVTGTNMPRPIISGEQIYAGSVLTQAKRPLLFRATSTAALSHLARLDAKIAHAKLEKSAIETATNRVLQYFIPGVFAAAVLSGVLIGVFFSGALAIQCAVSVLVSACPCTLGLITPLAIRIGIKKAADGGVVFNSAKKLESTYHIECVVFDLNGTLTQGMPRVTQYRALLDSGLSHEGLLSLLAHFEKGSPHPIAQAICTFALAKKVKVPTLEAQLEVTDHAGRTVLFEDKHYVLGSEAFMLRQGVELGDIDRIRMIASPQEGDSLVYLARAKKLIGYVVLHDVLREDANYVISAFEAMGIQPYLSTGADIKTALQYANQLRIKPEYVRANCVSHANADSVQSKKNVIDELRKKGLSVAAVGDGANDAEMIAAADVGFALSVGGDTHIQQQADAVIQGHALLPVLHAFSVAKRTVSNIKENLMFSFFYNIAAVCITGGILLGFGVVLNPAVGAALMIIQTSMILLNLYRFSKHREVEHTMLNPAQIHDDKKKWRANIMSLLSESPKPRVQLEKKEAISIFSLPPTSVQGTVDLPMNKSDMPPLVIRSSSF